jgi:hypothetical protein
MVLYTETPMARAVAELVKVAVAHCRSSTPCDSRFVLTTGEKTLTIEVKQSVTTVSAAPEKPLHRGTPYRPAPYPAASTFSMESGELVVKPIIDPDMHQRRAEQDAVVNNAVNAVVEGCAAAADALRPEIPPLATADLSGVPVAAPVSAAVSPPAAPTPAPPVPDAVLLPAVDGARGRDVGVASNMDMVMACWERGFRAKSAIALETGLTLQQVHANISHLKKRGLIAETPPIVPVESGEAQPSPDKWMVGVDGTIRRTDYVTFIVERSLTRVVTELGGVDIPAELARMLLLLGSGDVHSEEKLVKAAPFAARTSVGERLRKWKMRLRTIGIELKHLPGIGWKVV